MKRLLLCTDLDRTLLPNGTQPESAGARETFSRLVAHPAVRLVYVTGRDPGLVEEAIATWCVPVPDLLVADVGTTIASPGPGRWDRWSDWDNLLATDWADQSPEDLRHLIADIAGLSPQEPSRQTDFKLSWFTPRGPEGRRVEETVRTRLASVGVRANVIWSEDETTAQGLLDVLPLSATKRRALEFVIARWSFRPDEVVFAGDSGNDLDVLASVIPAVLVANADSTVREEARRIAIGDQLGDRLYLAAGGALGMNGNYAAGIIEGVLHYHPEWAGVLEEEP